MKTRLLMAGWLFAGMNAGCMLAPPTPALPDVDNDGLLDLESVDGVDTSQTVEVVVVNELTKAELSSLIPVQGFEGLVDLIEITIKLDITLSYDVGDATTTITQVLDAFRLPLEVIGCPEQIDAVATVTAAAPFVGTVFETSLPPVTLTQGTGGGLSFDCNTRVNITAFLNDRGQPDFNVTFESLSAGRP